MNEVKIFINEEFGKIRTVEKNDQIWFVAKDVCDCLDIKNSRDALTKLDNDEKGDVGLTDTIGREQKNSIINEYGLYNLILTSRKPEAKQFKRWITHEVLPSIREHGGYMQGQEQMTPEELMARALRYADSKMKELEIKNSQLAVQTAIMKPKAEYFDEMVDRNLLTSFRDTAKQLKVPERKFITYLIDKKYLYRDKKGKLKSYANKNSEELFETKEFINNKTNFTATQTLVTPKGREVFRLLTNGLA